MMVNQINPFATGDTNMRQLFHCLQWYASPAVYYYYYYYAGSERVKEIHTETCAVVHYGTMKGRSYITIKLAA